MNKLVYGFVLLLLCSCQQNKRDVGINQKRDKNTDLSFTAKLNLSMSKFIKETNYSILLCENYNDTLNINYIIRKEEQTKGCQKLISLLTTANASKIKNDITINYKINFFFRDSLNVNFRISEIEVTSDNLKEFAKIIPKSIKSKESIKRYLERIDDNILSTINKYLSLYFYYKKDREPNLKFEPLDRDFSFLLLKSLTAKDNEDINNKYINLMIELITFVENDAISNKEESKRLLEFFEYIFHKDKNKL